MLLLISLLWGDMIRAQYVARAYDVIIDEIMPDPAPPVLLPNAEFIELKNTSGFTLNLAGWRLFSSSSMSGLFPSIVLPPDSFLIIASTGNASLFSSLGKVAGIPSFPALNNDGATLWLISKEGNTIHAMTYLTSSLQNPVKQEGGWCIEMADTDSPCTGTGNWKYSQDPAGGTPGKKNSVDAVSPDISPPRLVRTFSTDSLTLTAVFDEPLDSSAVNVHDFSIAGLSLIAVKPSAPLFNEVMLQLSTPMQRQTVYELEVQGVSDCKGNSIGAFNKAKAGYAEPVQAMDLVINEILFDPQPGGSDFVELCNNSKKIVDASRLFIANRNSTGLVNTPRKCSEAIFNIFPGDHIVVTQDPVSLQNTWMVKYPELVLTVPSLPTFPDDKGSVVITNGQGEIIDYVSYDSQWHFPLLNDKQGVSLERINPYGPSNESANWHSSSSTYSYGTPTSRNSQYYLIDDPDNGISVFPGLFSADNDGIDDFTTISYKVSGTGYTANVYVFDINGRLVTYLVKNRLLGITGWWLWEGLDENQQRLPSGNYIIYSELLDIKGKVQKFKNIVTLARAYR